MDDNKNSSDRCVLCLDQKRSPVRLQCDHSFCFGCLDVYKSYKKYPWANKCPICRDVLKEKKRTTKRKYSDANVNANADSQNTIITPVIETETDTSSTTNPSTMSEQINTFEEFMALAFDVYENVDDSVQDLTEDDDTYYDGEHDTLTDLDFTDSFHDELNYYTDSDDYNDSQDDYDRDYYYFDNDDDDVDDSYQSPHNRSHVDGFYAENDYNDEHDENSIINVDDSVGYEVDSLMPRDWNNNLNADIDWETVIASDVIIID